MNQYFFANATLSMFAKYYMELKKGLPVRPSEMGVLNIISGTQGPHTPVMLAELLGVSKPMITAHLSDLAKKGYIKKNQSLEDKRVFYIQPTAKALKLVKSAETALNRQLEQLENEMGHDEFENLVNFAQKANNILKTKYSMNLG